MKLNTNKIQRFLKSLNNAEFYYVQNCVNIAGSIKNMIRTYKLTKEFICEEFKVSDDNYDAFISGGYNYSVNDISTMEYLYKEFEKAEIEKHDIVKIVSK